MLTNSGTATAIRPADRGYRAAFGVLAFRAALGMGFAADVAPSVKPVAAEAVGARWLSDPWVVSLM